MFAAWTVMNCSATCTGSSAIRSAMHGKYPGPGTHLKQERPSRLLARLEPVQVRQWGTLRESM